MVEHPPAIVMIRPLYSTVTSFVLFIASTIFFGLELHGPSYLFKPFKVDRAECRHMSKALFPSAYQEVGEHTRSIIATSDNNNYYVRQYEMPAILSMVI